MIYPKLPLKNEIELESSRIISKKLIQAHQNMGALKEASFKIPRKNILSSLFTLKEAQTSSCVEGIETTNEDLFGFTYGNIKNKEDVKKYQHSVINSWEHINKRQNKVIGINDIKLIRRCLFNNTEGFRTSDKVRIVNTKTGDIILQPVEAKSINAYLDNLLVYINKDSDKNNINDVDDFIKLAISHVQFETIHPFTDGNGRTGRVLIILFLLLKGYIGEPILYLSSYINDNKDLYYKYLHECNEKESYNNFVEFMLDAIIETSAQTIKKIHLIEKKLKELKDILENDDILKNISKPRDLIDVLYSRFWITQQKTLEKLNITRPTLSKYLNRLVEIGILEKKKITKETRFYNKTLIEIFTQK